jgi:hypothetical protein
MIAPFPFGRLALIALSLFANGCLTPKNAATETAQSDKIERRESVLLKSKYANAPSRAGLDSRAREIENSLGIR